ncbi:hypothetical protein C3B51_02700 [Pseudoalteromonas rubra]|uniref:Lipoprotein n=1 Tax=Pseudoalteromonas rubra TaxID=43658 RepID=A0A4V2E439_9GAMM|nr:hypothetical protein [Pseudoalteromonas rubra]RZM84744.1 hypothetical protein C3B51_02700 [Pseudoalteromonas rubra]
MLTKLVTLTGLSLLLTGCIQDSNASSQVSSKVNHSPTAGTVQAKTTHAQQSSPRQSQPDITMREASAEILFSSEYIDPWQSAPKHITVLTNATEFQEKFDEYTIEQLADIDFKTHSVVLFDMGTRDKYSCGSEYQFDAVNAEILTASYVSSTGTPLATKTTRVNIETRQCLTDQEACVEVYEAHRPYYFFVVEREGELSVTESVTFANCQPPE